MLYALIYHGWPISTSSGRFERHLLHSIANQIDGAFPTQNNLLINGTWLNWDFQHAVEDLMIHYQPTNVFITSLTDPWSMDRWAQDKFSAADIYLIGNVATRWQFNYWAMYCDLLFQDYQDHELQLDVKATNIFLCYQNKINPYRTALYERLCADGTIKHGHLTYWQLFGNSGTLFREEKNVLDKMCMEHDGIGDMSMWNRCLINIVSETEHVPDMHTFLTEKTWKPIIGLRPFMINGNPGIYTYLKDNGFRTFDDWFPVTKIQQANGPQAVASLISDTIKDIAAQNVCLHDMYQDMTKDIVYNKNRFKEFVAQQYHAAENLF